MTNKICPECGSRPNTCVVACVEARSNAQRERELDAFHAPVEAASNGAIMLEFAGDIDTQRMLVNRFVAQCHLFEYVQVIEPTEDGDRWNAIIARSEAGLGGPLEACYVVSLDGFARSRAHDDWKWFFERSGQTA